MANQYGINMGQVYRTASQVKNVRQQRKLNEMKIAAQKQKVKARENKMKALKRLQADEKGAMMDLAAIAPEEANSILDARKKMSEQQRKKAKRRAQEAGRLSAAIVQSPNPQQLYVAGVKAGLIPNEVMKQIGPEVQPKDLNKFAMYAARARETEKLMDNEIRVDTVGRKDQVRQENPVTGQWQVTDETQSQKAREAETPELSASDENTISKEVVSTMGIEGFVDKNGNFIMQSDKPELRHEAQAIKELATQIYLKGETNSLQGATAQALRDFGWPVPEGPGNDEKLSMGGLVNKYSQ